MKEDKKHTQQEAKVTDAVHDKCLLSSIIVCFVLKPETDEQIGGQAHAFPTDEHAQEAVAEDKDEHSEDKEVQVEVVGDEVYGILKFESGVHRVQRVPDTEASGRVHTSAASVAVLPEADEFDVELNDKDIRKDTFCSSGPGGQSVNTTYSAIRLTHIPTGIVVQCQDEKSQLKNYEKALSELRTRIYNMEYEKYLNDIAAKRKTMVSSGDRSAKIRTYNYPQSRVTDHRINYTMHNLPVFMDGEIQEVIDLLHIAENTERLKDDPSNT